ncbi:MAG: Zn-ribbon domain-containing OB-fold protein [Myxococcota bacterium]
MSEKVFRVLPRLTPENEHFWTGGAQGELRFLRCQDCKLYIHPPQPICPDCLSKNLAVEAVSGRAEVLTYTINHQPWIPGVPLPYAIAIVELVEQKGLRLMTNIVNCPVEAVGIGMKVRVLFEQHDAVYVPLFEPEVA